MITSADLERRLARLEPIGLGADGTTRLAWTAQDAAAGEWFEEQAATAGLVVERDAAGNRWAVPDAPAPWWALGSHLDSVRCGGRYDGALGVTAAFAVASASATPVAVIAFADEEGARFNTPTFGSRALVGRLDVDDALGRTDDDGVVLADALRAAGVDPAGLAGAGAGLERLRGFLELHIDQGRAVARQDAPVGVVSALAARVRLRAELLGRADHAGTTPLPERRDALAAAARLIVAAEDLAASEPGTVATAGRLLVEPNAPTTVPARVCLWLDARAGEPQALDRWRGALAARAAELEAQRGVTIRLTTAADNPPVRFDPDLRARLTQAARTLGHGAPEVICFAGHDAGILAERLPAAMVLVRNHSGVSHAPDEHVDLRDAALAAGMLQSVVEALA